jgi:CHAT domain-containing protein
VVTADVSDSEVSARLDEAAVLMHQDPGAARALAETCIDTTDSPVLLARADYVQAQVHAIEGGLDRALELVERAQERFRAAGADFDALRTELGRMHILNELGRHDDAISRGLSVLERLEGSPHAVGPPERGWWLRASVHRNLSVCHTFAGRHGTALQEGRAAEDAYRRVGMLEELASVRQNTGELLLDLGRVQEALAAFESAAATFRASGQTLLEARCLIDLGRANALTGRWTDGLQAFDTARSYLERLDVRADLDQLLLRSAEAWLSIGLHDEALVAYQEAEPSLRRSGQTHYLAQVLTGAGSALARAGRLADADNALTEAAALHSRGGNVPLQARVLVELADVHARRGDGAAARRLADEAVDLLSGGEWATELVYAHLRAADLRMEQPDDLPGAQRHLAAAARLATPLGLPPLQYRVDARVGRLSRRQGNTAAARAALASAARIVEALRVTLPNETMRASFLRDAAAPYADLVALELSAGNVTAALWAAERSKSRALTDLLARVHRPRSSGADPTPASELHEELMATYNELLHDDPGLTGDGRARHRAALRARAAQVEAAMRAERLRSAPADVHPVGAPVAPAELVRRLPEDLAVLAYHVVDDRVVAFLICNGTVRTTPSVTTLGRIRPLLRQLDAQWQRTRVGGAFATRHAARLAAGATRVLQELHGELLGALELPDVERLVIIPHGCLHEVPFHALHDGSEWLLERFTTFVAPSLSVLVATLDLPRADGPALVLAVPDAAATAVEREARVVAEPLPGARLRVGEQAAVGALCAEAPGSAVVHIACHGLFRPENPMFSALRLGDRWLTAAELLEVDLAGSLVALSACETGRTRAEGAGDEIVGLARAALGAGASAVLVSLWLVNDASAASLMSRWYILMGSGAGPATALRAAQRERALAGEHPYHWAPFVLVGSP